MAWRGLGKAQILPVVSAFCVTLALAVACATGVALRMGPALAGFLLLCASFAAGGEAGPFDIDRAVLGAIGGAANGELLQQAAQAPFSPWAMAIWGFSLLGVFLSLSSRLSSGFNRLYLLLTLVTGPLLAPGAGYGMAAAGGAAWFWACARIARKVVP